MVIRLSPSILLTVSSGTPCVSVTVVAKVCRAVLVIFRNAIKNRMTIIKRKTFIIKHFARIAEQTDLQKKTKYCDVSVTRLLAACFENNGR